MLSGGEDLLKDLEKPIEYLKGVGESVPNVMKSLA